MRTRKILWGTVAAAGLACVLAAPDANAFTLLGGATVGDALQFDYNGFTVEDTGIPGLGTNSNGLETTWGAGVINDIKDVNLGTTAWVDQQQGQSLAFMIYGIADQQSTLTSPSRLLNNGCTAGAGNSGSFAGCDGSIHIDFYLRNGADPAFGTPTGVKVSGRTAIDQLAGITNVGTKFMSWTFTPGVVLGNNGAQLFQLVAGLSLPTTGHGEALADCVSGPGCGLFNTAAESDFRAASGSDPGADSSVIDDFFIQFTLDEQLTKGTAANGWEGHINGPIQATVSAVLVPEPGTIATFGLGLLGLGGLARRFRRTA